MSVSDFSSTWILSLFDNGWPLEQQTMPILSPFLKSFLFAPIIVI